MVAPLVIGGIAAGVLGQVIQGKAQLDQARAQNRLDEQTYQQLQDIYGRLEAQYQAYMDGYQLPPGSVPPFTPQEMELIGQFQPEIPNLVQESAPELITESASGQEMAAQREALADYRNLAQTGDDAISRSARERASFEADQKMKSLRAGVLRDRASRGMLGSGDELLASLQGADTAAINARQDMLGAQEAAQQRRLGALAASANLAGSIRQQNTGTERANAEIMNAFNQRMAANQNVYNQNVANTQNQAQMTNLQAAQNVANQNVNIRNQAQMSNLQAQQQAQENLRQAQNQRLGMGTQFAQNTAQNQANLAQTQAQMGANKLATRYLPNQIAGSTISSLGSSAADIGVSQMNKPKVY